MAENEQKNESLAAGDSSPDAEGTFVPYASEFHEGKQKAKKMLRLLMITFCAVVAVTLTLAVLRHQNFYHKAVKQLAFDYREGEAIDTETDVGFGTFSAELAKNMTGNLSFTARQTLFNMEGKFIPAISDYEYTASGKEQYLTVRTGTENAIFTGGSEQRLTAEGYALKKGSKWETSSEYAFPNYKQLFFGVDSTDKYTFVCYDSYATIVDVRAYTCELWLIEDHTGGGTTYYTVYRYYNAGGRLMAVRVLSDRDEVMEVYEITGYTT